MSYIKHFKKNHEGRDLIVGDVHGHFTKLKQALDAVGFDPALDRLFSVGDLVDRGPECDQVMDWLEKPWFFPVTGNHEDMAIRWPDGNMDTGNYVANGGAWNISNPRELQCEIAETLSALPLGIELETEAGLVGIVHAECPYNDWDMFRAALDHPTISWDNLDRIKAIAQWARTRIDYGDRSLVRGVRAMVVGHTPVPEHTVMGNVHYIDTGAWLGARCPWEPRFTLLDAETLEVVKP